ncbi:hypothetical protein [Halomonas denitrificans]|nr:hypothetical protein [Halomonas denitrificans]
MRSKMRLFCVAICLLATAGISAENFSVTADEACVPDLRPAKDSVVPGAVFDAVEDGVLTLGVDVDGDGRGELMIRLRPESSNQLGLLRELVAGADEFRLHARGAAARTVELVLSDRLSIWLPVRTPNCRLPDDWVAGREVLVLQEIAWLRTPDGPELALGDGPVPETLREIHRRMGVAEPAACRAGGPGALSCSYATGTSTGPSGEAGRCHAACAGESQYACCAPTACGCESVGLSASSGRTSGAVP